MPSCRHADAFSLPVSPPPPPLPLSTNLALLNGAALFGHRLVIALLLDAGDRDEVDERAEHDDHAGGDQQRQPVHGAVSGRRQMSAAGHQRSSEVTKTRELTRDRSSPEPLSRGQGRSPEVRGGHQRSEEVTRAHRSSLAMADNKQDWLRSAMLMYGT